MKLLAKENFPKASERLLREMGYDVLSIGEDAPSITDEHVIALAIREERLVLTFDKDYGKLVFRKGLKPKKGIIYLRIETFEPREPAEIIHALLESNRFEFENALTVADKVFVRQRKY
ncbi:MAG: DUF5615 family PIN-like protein [Chitinophagales bacterium]|nr:DUF5615 family PIN-like protein [Chitinophagales bacterium]